MNRNELLAEIDGGRAALDTALARFTDREMVEPVLPGGWSVKDLVAHIGVWEQRIVTLYDLLAAGQAPPDTVEGETLDAFNARAHHDNRARPLDDVRSSELEAYRALRAITESAPADHLFDPEHFEWTGGEPFANLIVANTYGHYRDHVPDLLAVEI